MAEMFKDYPGTKTYRAVDGHTYEVEPNRSPDGEWYYVYALGYHSDQCTCTEYFEDEYAGEHWDE